MAEKTQVILNCEKLETRFAFLKNGRLEEYEIERQSDEVMPGSIYLGRIVKLEPTLEAAFVDIGAERNAFLHYKDMLPATYDIVESIKKIDNEAKKNEDADSVGAKGKKLISSFSEKIRNFLGRADKSKRLKELETSLHNGRISIKDIPKMFPAGSELLVQVTKGPIGTKGARITTNLTIPGRYLVLLPYSDHIGLSSKIDDGKERNRLRKILDELDLPDGMGLICRTVGEGRKEVFFKRDLDMLMELWGKVEDYLERPKAPALVYKEPTLLERTVRDFLTEDIGEIIVDNPDAHRFLRDAFHKFVGNDFDTKVVLHNRAEPIFERYKVAEQVKDIFNRVVQLPSGGYICIDETEALVAIDVNSGRNRASKDHPETILKTNLEAAEEVARQLKLRNIGGQVVIDFIDMRGQKDRDNVLKQMRKHVRNDRARTRLLPLSKFGLMEMTRQREHESIKDAVYDLCPYCNGTGRVKSSMSMSVEIQRRLLEVLKRNKREKGLAVRVIMHPTILARLKNEDANLLEELEESYGKDLSFRADSSIHIEQFKVVDPETNEEFR